MRLLLKTVLVLFCAGRLALGQSASAFKGERFSQTSASPATSLPSDTFIFEVSLDGFGFAQISNPQLILPGGAAKPLVPTPDADTLKFSQSAATAAALDAAFPPGTYGVNMTSAILGPLSSTAALGADAFPTAPQVLNYLAAQSIDPTKDFDVTWAPFTGGTADDQIQLIIFDTDGTVISDSGTLDGLQTSTTVYSSTLEASTTYKATLTFRKLSTNVATSLPPLAIGFYAETQFQVHSSAGPVVVDTIPPTLSGSAPMDGATNYLLSSPVYFSFSEPMAPTYAIQWSPNLDAKKFSYSWFDTKTLAATYAGGLPGGAIISWTLNRVGSGTNGFKDVAGNPLAPVSGKFYTFGINGGGCSGSGPVDGSTFGLFKELDYVQTAAGVATPSPTNAASIFGFFNHGSGYDSVTIEFPASPAPLPHQIKPFISTLLGSELFSVVFPNQTALDQAYPGGNYAFQLRNYSLPPASQVTNQVVLSLPLSGYPPIPHFANFPTTQAFDPAADFTLSWDGFMGSAASDAISITITDDQNNVVLQAPDACKGIDLPVTATSIVIPKGTLQGSKTYTARLSFFHVSDQGKVLPNTSYQGVAAASTSTELNLKPGTVTPVAAPVFTSIVQRPDGDFDVTVQCTPNHPFTLEQTTSLLTPYSALIVTNPPLSTLTLRVPTGPHTFLRGRSE
jgi:hypothetical protein